MDLSEGVHPLSVIGHKDMRFFNLLRRHFLDHFFQADGGIRIAANGRQRVPHVRPDQVWRGHTPTDFVIPRNPRLRARMPLEGASEVPFEGPHVISLDPQAHGIHDANEFLGIRIARPGRRQQTFAGLFKLSHFHEVTGNFNVRGCGTQTQAYRQAHGQAGRPQHRFQFHHALLCSFFLCGFTHSVQASSFVLTLPAPLTDDDFIPADPQQAQLGHLLFYDKILSGNQNISCATCHHPDFGSTDGLSLGIGEGGVGLGPDRTPGTGSDKIVRRIPRNAPALWNLGAKEIEVLMHDGRISAEPLFGDNGFNTPAEEWLPHGLTSVLATQALFPMTSEKEMLGQNEENEIAGRVKDRIDYGWPIIAKRVRTTPAYGAMFVDAFDHIETPDQVTIVEIGNALAAFMTTEFRSTDSPFDVYLAGDQTALTDQQKQGMNLFFGAATCASCHAGSLFSDHGFRALALPAFGPGRTRKFDPINRDVGRMGATDDLEDAYRFRTPMLRNVAITAPYGHNGAYPTLERMIRHHMDPAASRAAWTPDDLTLPEVPWRAAADFVIQQDRFEMARQAAKVDIALPPLTDTEIDQIVSFLESLTGATVHDLPFGVPDQVPSGLPVDKGTAQQATIHD